MVMQLENKEARFTELWYNSEWYLRLDRCDQQEHRANAVLAAHQLSGLPRENA